MTMQLKALKLERCRWSHMAEYGKIEGTITFDGELGEIQLKLTPELCHKMFLICAEGLVGVAREAASALILEAQATIAQDVTPPLANGS